MNEQHQRSDHSERNQRSGPGRMTNPTDSTNCLAHRHDGGKDPVEFVLNDFLILPKERIHKAERADRPGIVVAPHQQEDPDNTECGRQHEPGPYRQRVPQGVAELRKTEANMKGPSRRLDGPL